MHVIGLDMVVHAMDVDVLPMSTYVCMPVCMVCTYMHVVVNLLFEA